MTATEAYPRSRAAQTGAAYFQCVFFVSLM
jgi:hypothetical protein